jgi:hypothetical protein
VGIRLVAVRVAARSRRINLRKDLGSARAIETVALSIGYWLEEKLSSVAAMFIAPAHTSGLACFLIQNTAPYVLGIHAKDRADVTKRENPIILVRHDPMLSFSKQLLPLPILSRSVLMKAIDGVLQQRRQQCLFGFQKFAAPKRAQILVSPSVITSDQDYLCVFHRAVLISRKMAELADG